MKSETDCPFCNRETQASWIVEQAELTYVILSNPRLLKGHILVIPKRHVEKPWELTPEERLGIFKMVDKYEQLLLANGATGVDIRQNYRPFLTQNRVKVDHVHFHVLPRTLEDDLYQRSMKYELDIFAELPDEERDDVLRMLKS